MTRTDHVADLLPAYVLGVLEDDECQAVQAHLETCAACRTEHQRLASLPALLELVEPRRAGADSRPPAYLEDAVVARLLSERASSRSSSRRGNGARPGRWRLGAAAVGGGLAGIVATLGLTGHLSAGDAPERVRLAAPGGSGASAEATLHRSAGNTRIDLRADGLAPTGRDAVYEVWLVHGDGRVSAGTFTVGTAGAVDVELNAAGLAASYDRIGISLEPDAADPALNGRNVLAATISGS